MTQASYFVRIDDPSDLRRQVLENSKSVIESLQRIEKLKDIRADKMNSIIKLRQIMSELFEINPRLRSGLPQPKMSPVLKRAVKKAPMPAPKAKPSNDLDKLESSLSQIESKLSKLE